MEAVNSEKQPENGPQVKRFDINYMHRPPRIIPNYGKKTKVSLLPKSNVPRVLLYDNLTQQQMLDVKLSHIRLEKSRSTKVLDTHKKTFLMRRLKKNKQVRDSLERVQRLHADLKYEHEFARDRASPERSVPSPRQPSVQDVPQPEATNVGEGRPASFNDMANINLPPISSKNATPQKERSALISAAQAFSLKGPWFSEGKPLKSKSKRNSVTGDSRFLELEASLSKTDHSLGYLELSPTFKRTYEPIPKHLLEMEPPQKDSSTMSDEDINNECSASVDSQLTADSPDG